VNASPTVASLRAALPFVALTLAAQPPTFSHDVAPVIYANCVACHRVGGAGPFPLLTYRDVRSHARQIAALTKAHYMPPWPPAAGSPEFLDERRLTAREIEMLTRWANAGAPQGSPEETPAPPVFSDGWQLGTPDLIIRASKPLNLPASGSDVFWNFVFDPRLTMTRYVRALEIRPQGEPDVRGPSPKPEGSQSIHHANLLIDRVGSTARLEASPGSGFPGMDVTIDRNPLDPESHFLFWKPGTLPYSEPKGFSWRLDPGNLLVLNTHVEPSGKPRQITPALGLYFTDEAPSRFPIVIELDRDDLLDIPSGAKDFVVSDRFRIPADSDLLAIYPHAHYLARLMEVSLTLPDGTEFPLLRIPDWDLKWQAVYRYRKPVFLPKDSIVFLRYHYDNSSGNRRNPNSPPKRVEAGNKATDEMAHLWLQLLPRGPGDRRRLIQTTVLEHKLEKNPRDYAANLNLGALALSRLDAQAAVSFLRTAIAIEPAHPEPHDMLGSALLNLGRLADAAAQFRAALRFQPDFMNAHYNLSRVLARTGDLKAAILEYQPVAKAYAASARIQTEYGFLLYRDGKKTEARSQFEKALTLDPTYADALRGRDLTASAETPR
jgi:Flp pilus assembly protein TadD/mono/diheme cytochrome c family protein